MRRVSMYPLWNEEGRKEGTGVRNGCDCLGESKGWEDEQGNSVATDVEGSPFFRNSLGQSNDTSLGDGVYLVINKLVGSW